MSEPNQKFILINRSSAAANNFFHFNHDIFFSAAKRLTLNGIRVFMYFMSLVPDSIDGVPFEKNTRNGFFELYTAKVAEVIGTNTQSVQRGINDLIANGYLTLHKGNVYQFIDILPEDKTQTVDEHQKVMSYQDELHNSLKKLSTDRDEQLRNITMNSITHQNEKYDWEE